MQTMALAMDKGGEELGSNLLSGVSLPAAVVHEGPLAHNVEWMQRFAEAHGARLAPHGKTTMTPALSIVSFRRVRGGSPLPLRPSVVLPSPMALPEY